VLSGCRVTCAAAIPATRPPGSLVLVWQTRVAHRDRAGTAARGGELGGGGDPGFPVVVTAGGEVAVFIGGAGDVCALGECDEASSSSKSMSEESVSVAADFGADGLVVAEDGGGSCVGLDAGDFSDGSDERGRPPEGAARGTFATATSSSDDEGSSSRFRCGGRVIFAVDVPGKSSPEPESVSDMTENISHLRRSSWTALLQLLHRRKRGGRS
jgi:hypothetical protein